MAEYQMLGEFVCFCNKCKLDLNHRIILMDGDEPSKVMCLTCQGQHKYRKKSAVAKKKPVAKSATVAQKSKARLSREETAWRGLLEDPNVTPKSYNLTETYKREDRIYHKKFGSGVVIDFDFPDKLHVYFDEGIKILKGKKAKNE